MLSNKGFDLWADYYDESVDISDNNESYPFAGYKIILNEIYNRILDASYKNILDIGFGTGTLISKLYEHGCKIYGQDFSEKMIEISKNKMPNAKLFNGDISKGLAKELLKYKYDAIIATYSLHHLKDFEKVTFLESLLAKLDDSGIIYIGDVAFETRDEHDKCMKKVSECAGIITLKK